MGKRNTLLVDALRVQREYYKGNTTASLRGEPDFTLHAYNQTIGGMCYEANRHEIVVALSGGADSVILHRYATFMFENVRALFVKYGQAYGEVEMDSITAAGIPCEVREMNAGPAKGMPQGDYTPGRNWFAAILAAEIIERHGDVWFGATAGEAEPEWSDISVMFAREGSRILSAHYRKPIHIVYPFADFTKTEIVRWFLRYGGTKQALLATRSCRNVTRYDELHCGVCPPCVLRVIAFFNNGIRERYQVNPKKAIKEIMLPKLTDPLHGLPHKMIAEVRRYLR